MASCVIRASPDRLVMVPTSPPEMKKVGLREVALLGIEDAVLAGIVRTAQRAPI